MADLKEILATYCPELPSMLTNEAGYFPIYLFSLFDNYYKTIIESENLMDSLIEQNDTTIIGDRKDTFCKELNIIIAGLKDSISAYLNGFPGEAYQLFENMISTTYLRHVLQTSQVKTLSREQSFYRLRTGEIDPPPTPIDLFHIPFEKRKVVATQRFSIPGYPCLYAGNSLNVSLKELGIFTTDDLATTKMVRMANYSKILYVDIEPYQMLHEIPIGIYGEKAKKAKDLTDIYYSGLLYPLIAACHCKITYEDPGRVSFKIEYIIPQLLLQWFQKTKDNRLIQGIRYLSNRIDSGDVPEKMYNYVFPVKNGNQETGHCENLKNLFGVTQPVDAFSFPFTKSLFSERVEELEQHLNNLPLINLNKPHENSAMNAPG